MSSPHGLGSGLYQDDLWNMVSGSDLAPFLKQINPINGQFNLSEETASVAWRQLPFYKNVALIRVHDSSWGETIKPFWFLAKQGGQIFHLDGTSAPIHEANEAGPVKVTEANALDYLRFFCMFVHGDDGPFLIIESMENPAMPTEAMADGMRQAIADSIVPAAYEGKTDSDEFDCTGIVLYGNALFSARFAITHDGMIEMTDDDPIAADLPVDK